VIIELMEEVLTAEQGAVMMEGVSAAEHHGGRGFDC
jgi:hypothetical protein